MARLLLREPHRKKVLGVCTAELEGIYAEQIGKLVPAIQHSGKVLQGVMWDKKTQKHRFHTFRFNQVYQGLPVYKSGIGFLVRNEDNYPVVMTSSNFKEMAGFDTADAANTVEAKATQVMIDNTARMMDEAGPISWWRKSDIRSGQR